MVSQGNVRASGPETPTVIGATAHLVVRVLASRGMNGRDVAEQAGVPAAVFSDPSARFPSSTLDRLVALAAERCDDDAFGLTLAKHHRGVSRELHFAMMASETLVEAWRRMHRYHVMVSEGLSFELDVRASGDAVVTFSVPEPEVGRWIPADTMGASHVLGARGLTMVRKIAPSHVALRRPKPARTERYEELFRCPIAFSRDDNVIAWDKAAAVTRLPLSNAELALKTDGLITEYLEQWRDGDLVNRVRRLLLRELPAGVPGREQIARKLGLSPRTLSRELAAQGASYRELLADVRSTLATAYLRDGASITEIAFALGFSETSAFCRAFRRWTGQSPTAYAASHGGTR